jgi:UDP-glucuronate 4-epimerase
MTQERFFLTGALGCIGAWVVRNLVREEVDTAVLDFSQNHHRLQLIMDDKEIDRVHFITGDISEFSAVEHAMQEFHPTAIIHLAALQLPFCAADPVQGAKVNVVGTVNLFELAKRMGIQQIVYASSAAVYGMSEEYPEEVPLAHDAPLKPRSHYGVYKQANEGTARVYWMDNGLSSVGLRPYVVYGAGRDQGMTSTPTQAMVAAVAGLPYHISYGGRFCFQYANDVARTFIQAARTPFKGAEVFNIGGGFVDMSDIVTAIEHYQPKAKGKITYEKQPLPFPEDMDNSPLVKAIGSLPETPLSQGVEETIRIFQQALSEGKIKPPSQ